MRLIDADKLIEGIEKQVDNRYTAGVDTALSESIITHIINAQPTVTPWRRIDDTAGQGGRKKRWCR